MAVPIIFRIFAFTKYYTNMNYSYGSLKLRVCRIYNAEDVVNQLNDEGKIVVDVKGAGYEGYVLILYREDYHNETEKG